MNRVPTNTPTFQIDISEFSAALAYKLQLFSRKFSNPGAYVRLQNHITTTEKVLKSNAINY